MRPQCVVTTQQQQGCQRVLQVLRVIGRCSEATAKECFGDLQFATTLVATLDDPNPAVRAALCFAVCNLCATASCPARQLLLDKVCLLLLP